MNTIEQKDYLKKESTDCGKKTSVKDQSMYKNVETSTNSKFNKADYCPDCGNHLLHESACVYCPVCGYDQC